MTHVDLVRVLGRNWPDGSERWRQNVEQLFEVAHEHALFNRILSAIDRSLEGRQLDWGAWIAYASRDQVLDFLGPPPAVQAGEAWWEAERRETRQRIAALPAAGDYGLIAIEDY